MKIIKLSLAAFVAIIAADTSASTHTPKQQYFTATYFLYSIGAAQNAAAFNTATNYTKESSGICMSTAKIFCELAVTAITHTSSMGVKTIPVLPSGTGTKISTLTSGGKDPAPSGTYTVDTKSVIIDFKL